jgi:hypothetical protein
VSGDVKRDRRLLVPLALLVIAVIALGYQAIIVRNYVWSSIMDHNWESMVELYGIEAPEMGPERFCFDYCAPRMPFVAGWVGIASLVSAIVSLLFVWWSPLSK